MEQLMWKDRYWWINWFWAILFIVGSLLLLWLFHAYPGSRGPIQVELTASLMFLLGIVFVLCFRRRKITHLFEILLIGGILISVAYVLSLFLTSYFKKTFLTYITPTIIILVSAWFSYSFIRIKTIYIAKEGIRIGNAYPKHDLDLLLRQKSKFFVWGDIRNVKIIKRGVVITGAGGTGLLDFVVIETKEGERLQCFIKDPRGFVATIKNLNKSDLISKYSKYRELLK